MIARAAVRRAIRTAIAETSVAWVVALLEEALLELRAPGRRPQAGPRADLVPQGTQGDPLRLDSPPPVREVRP